MSDASAAQALLIDEPQRLIDDPQPALARDPCAASAPWPLCCGARLLARHRPQRRVGSVLQGQYCDRLASDPPMAGAYPPMRRAARRTTNTRPCRALRYQEATTRVVPLLCFHPSTRALDAGPKALVARSVRLRTGEGHLLGQPDASEHLDAGKCRSGQPPPAHRARAAHRLRAHAAEGEDERTKTEKLPKNILGRCWKKLAGKIRSRCD